MEHQEIVGLDESASARAALRWTSRHTERTGSELRAVHALSWPYGVSASVTDAQAGHLSDDQIEDIYRASITQVFDEIHPRPDWLIQFAKGDAGPVLVRRSRHAALLVIGSPDHVGLGRLIAGSVAHFCVSRAACPVVVVPSPQPPADVILPTSHLVTNGARS